jgi:colicin import membrane protein
VPLPQPDPRAPRAVADPTRVPRPGAYAPPALYPDLVHAPTTYDVPRWITSQGPSPLAAGYGTYQRPAGAPAAPSARPPWVGAGGTAAGAPAVARPANMIPVRSRAYLETQAGNRANADIAAQLAALATPDQISAPYQRAMQDAAGAGQAAAQYNQGLQSYTVDLATGLPQAAQASAQQAQNSANTIATLAGGSAQPAANIAPTLASAGTASANTLGAFAAAAPVQAQQAAGGYQQQLLDALNQRQHDVNQINAQRPSLEAGYLDTAVGQNQALAAGNRDYSANRSDARYQQGYQNRTFTEGKREADRTYTAGRFDANRSYTANRADTAAARAADAAKAAEATREFNKTLGLQTRTQTANERIANKTLGVKQNAIDADAWAKSVAEFGRNSRAADAEAARNDRTAKQIAAANKRAAASRKAAAQAAATKMGATKDSNWSKTIDKAFEIAQGSAKTSTSTTSSSTSKGAAAAAPTKPTGYDVTVRDNAKGSINQGKVEVIHYGAGWDATKHKVPEGMEWVATRPVLPKSGSSASGSGSKTTTSTSGTKGSRPAAIAYLQQQARIQGRTLTKAQASGMVDAWLGS